MFHYIQLINDSFNVIYMILFLLQVIYFTQQFWTLNCCASFKIYFLFCEFIGKFHIPFYVIYFIQQFWTLNCCASLKIYPSSASLLVSFIFFSTHS
ncbi:hypothetical protein PUN28_019430 [Cardiocondyla obscurior]|uniref:Uncharacterized protein n=1 Tax=Cardiocondyla obscurior TaxID=286306 RepID=A0AAW2EFC9_9HYME